MNITSQSMEAMILRGIQDPDADPYLKKLFSELQALKKEIDAPSKVPIKTEHKTISNSKVPRKKRRQTWASVAKFAEKRSSDRLSGKIPRYKLQDDIDELENNRLYSNGVMRKSYDAIKPKRPMFRHSFNIIERVILSPEEITQDMLDNICYKLNDRVYDPINGSSCHQCRQKTIDTKTICRNLECIGVRGQFCGPCALNRYGIDVATALKDPYWSCFVCQGICNCSFCRSRKGKRPTGILAPIAKREGHDCVKDFLDSLKQQIFEEDDYKEHLNDPESFLGFKDNFVMLVEGREEIFGRYESIVEALLLKDIIAEFGSYFRGFTGDDINVSERKREALSVVFNNNF